MWNSSFSINLSYLYDCIYSTTEKMSDVKCGVFSCSSYSADKTKRFFQLPLENAERYVQFINLIILLFCSKLKNLLKSIISYIFNN